MLDEKAKATPNPSTYRLCVFLTTGHGDQDLFAKLHPSVVQGLPREPVEWRRSYGRPPRTVYVESTFVPYNPDIVPGEEDWTLLGRPFFHTYWAECDIDLYKASVKEEISDWLNDLRAKNVTDWLIVVVVNEESKVKTKILRTSVFDKIRSDFCNKQTDRCVVLTEPLKPDLRSGESWASLLSRMRQLLLQSYNKHLSKFEEFMRAQRERRTEKGWNFCQYFMLQEELAFMFEMLGLYEDSLVQYDELDALFTQFVLNHAAGDRADWLINFHKIQCSSWDGLCLSQPINVEKRQLIKRNRPSLLDFRNYLFSRQCTLLFLLLRPWEVAQRSIPFMHNCLKELDILQITLPPGAIACWIFLSCLEVLKTCEDFGEAGHMEVHSLHTANLRDYARKKMHELGLLCGLMPDLEPGSEQLGLVVDLIAGLGHRPGNSEPLEKLKEALSSKPSFQKHYLELSELAMGTYKHIGRIRSARLIGKDLATFYMKLDQPQNAEGFLMDALKTLKQEGWEMLADHTRLDLAECHRVLANHTKYVKTCVHIAASPMLNKEKRMFHQHGMVELAHELEKPEYVRCRPIFLLQEASPTQDTYVLNTDCDVKLTLLVNLLEPIHCDAISINLICQPVVGSSVDQSDAGKLPARRSSQAGRRTRHESTSSTSGINFYNHVTHVTKLAPSVIEMETYFERRSADSSVTTCGLQSKASLCRTDSGSSHQMVEAEIQKEDFGIRLDAKDVELKPGENTVALTGKLSEKGQYLISQLCIEVGQLQFLKSVIPLGVSFGVVRDLPSLHIQPASGKFFTGIPQEAMLVFHSGSYAFDGDLPVTLTPSNDLIVSGEDIRENNLIYLGAARPYQSQEYKLSIFATPEDGCETIKRQVLLECAALEQPAKCLLELESSLDIKHKVHTCCKKKYIQLLVQGRQGLEFELHDHSLTADSRDVQLLPMNKDGQTMKVNGECSASYMWQLKSNSTESPPVPCLFCLSYRQCNAEGDTEARKWMYPFTITDYKTLYTVSSEVSPPEGEDTCTTGSLCRLALQVHCLDNLEADATSLMYQILPDDGNWALSGKASGVFKMEGKLFQTVLYVMPLVGGYLPVPKARILKYHIPSTLDGTPDIKGTMVSEDAVPKPPSEAAALPELIGFSPAQVYNASLGTQVQVLPAVNTSHMDITVAE